MTDEQKLGEEKEGESVETKAEISTEKTETAEKKTEYKRSDYKYKSWSGGVPVPEGWERCPGYTDVIRRLKVEPPKPEESTPDKTENKYTES